jgi:hypothetical protein
MTVGSAININRAEWTVNPLRENTGRHGTKGSFALTSMKAAIVSLLTPPAKIAIGLSWA